jgi:hypothetical protein
MSVGRFITNYQTVKRTWGPSVVDSHMKRMYWVDTRGVLYGIDVITGFVTKMDIPYPEKPKLQILQLAVPPNSTRSEVFAIMATPDATVGYDQRLWLELVPMERTISQPLRLYLFRFRLFDLKSAPIATIDPIKQLLFIYFRLVAEDHDILYCLGLQGSDQATVCFSL